MSRLTGEEQISPGNQKSLLKTSSSVGFFSNKNLRDTVCPASSFEGRRQFDCFKKPIGNCSRNRGLTLNMKTKTQIKEHDMLHHEFSIDMCYETIDLHLAKLPERFQRDREDLRQDILLAVMERSFEFDPSLASWATFEDRLIGAWLENFMLGLRWQKNRLSESLDEIDEYEPQRVPKTNDTNARELNMQENAVFFGEVQNTIDTMPPRLRDCAECLKYYSPAETAKMLGISPSAVHRDMKKIHKIFKKANVHPNHFEEF